MFTVPVQFFYRDDRTRMDTEELRIQKSPFDPVKHPTGKEDLLRDLMFERQNLPTSTLPLEGVLVGSMKRQRRKKAKERKISNYYMSAGVSYPKTLL